MGSYKELGKYYDYLNYDCDYEKWSQYLINILEKNNIKNGVGLDFACGSGKLTEIFAANGYTMIGVDKSEDMLQNAMRNKKRNNSVYLLGDMTSINLDKCFDFINISCDGVNYINPKEQFFSLLQNCNKHLKKSGLLLFDISSEHKLCNVLGNNIFADDREEATYIWQNYYNKSCKELDFSMILFTKQGKSYLKSYEQHKMFVYDIAYIIDALKAYNFSDIESYSAFTFTRPKEKSHRIQFICKKG